MALSKRERRFGNINCDYENINWKDFNCLHLDARINYYIDAFNFAVKLGLQPIEAKCEDCGELMTIKKKRALSHSLTFCRPDPPICR